MKKLVWILVFVLGISIAYGNIGVNKTCGISEGGVNKMMGYGMMGNAMHGGGYYGFFSFLHVALILGLTILVYLLIVKIIWKLSYCRGHRGMHDYCHEHKEHRRRK